MFALPKLTHLRGWLIAPLSVALAAGSAKAYDGFIFHKMPDSCYNCTSGRGAGQVAQPDGKVDFERGVEFFQSADYLAALPYFQRATQLSPNDIRYQRWLAECQSRLGNRAEAQNIFHTLLERDDLSAADATSIRADYNAIEETIRREALQSVLREIDNSTIASALEKAERKAVLMRETQKAETLLARSEAGRILAGVQSIRVPPPIPPETAQIQIGQLPPEDDDNYAVLLGKAGVLALDMVAQLKDLSIAQPIDGVPILTPIKIILVVNDVVTTDLDAAQVYVSRKDAQYTKALSYLKNPQTRSEFIEITRRLSEGLPVSDNTEIVQVARALNDPKRGTTSATLIWDAMMSSDAKNAVLTRLGIDAVLELVGKATERAVKLEMIPHDVEASKAADFLSHAKVALSKTSDPEAVASLKEAIRLADEKIDLCFKMARPAVVGMTTIESFFANAEMERGSRISPPALNSRDSVH